MVYVRRVYFSESTKPAPCPLVHAVGAPDPSFPRPLTGVESMSLNSMGGGAGGLPPGIDPKFIQADRDGAAVLIPMGVTSENVAAKFGISRAQQVGCARVQCGW